jgi:mediator of RNA polymerase II transcription subunit 1
MHFLILTLTLTNSSHDAIPILFQALPDQTHCYFMTETPQLEGIIVSTISFTLASQLPSVISTLRQQLTFNTLVGSCIRVGSNPGRFHYFN